MVLTEQQKEYLEELIFEDCVYSYDEICEKIGGPRPPIRAAIKEMVGVIRFIKCPECGREVVVTWFNRQQRFCCISHKNKYHSSRRKKTKLTICQNCGKEFYQYSFRNSVYCSCSCAAEHREAVKREKKKQDSDNS